MKNCSTTPMYIAKIGYITLSVILIIFGICFMMMPESSLIIMGRILGILLLIFGAVKITGYFSKDLFRLAFQYDLQLGTVIAVLGAILLFKPAILISVSAAVLGIIFLTDGLFRLQTSLDSKKFGIRGWWLILILSIVTCLIGILIMIKPEESASALAVLLGLSLIAEGVLNLYVVLTTVRIIKNQIPDEIAQRSVNATWKEI